MISVFDVREVSARRELLLNLDEGLKGRVSSLENEFEVKSSTASASIDRLVNPLKEFPEMLLILLYSE